MMNHLVRIAHISSFLLMVMGISSCQKKEIVKEFTVKNNLDMDRPAETVSIPVDENSVLIKELGGKNIIIKEGDKVLVSQVVDYDADGAMDEVLFQTDLKAGEEKKFTIEATEDSVARPANSVTTYSRFVPERIDDYAWENDRVAFRTYGPKAQQLTESGQPGGTLTSGMDCWFKRVNYPIIDKWYKKNLEEQGYYHIDHGEGYDPYHVGGSRGCGGIGVFDNDSLYVSKNFTTHRILASGPIRTVFEITYAPWNANGRTVTEKKVISLDLGSNLSRYEVTAMSDEPLPNIAIGIALHDKKGEVKMDAASGWFRYWETIDDSELGTGIVLAPAVVLSTHDHRTDAKDQSHILVAARPVEDKVVYYAGFGWKKSGQFNNVDEWDQYLTNFSKRIASPLVIQWVP